jgi:hypothetical protein
MLPLPLIENGGVRDMKAGGPRSLMVAALTWVTVVHFGVAHRAWPFRLR